MTRNNEQYLVYRLSPALLLLAGLIVVMSHHNSSRSIPCDFQSHRLSAARVVFVYASRGSFMISSVIVAAMLLLLLGGLRAMTRNLFVFIMKLMWLATVAMVVGFFAEVVLLDGAPREHLIPSTAKGWLLAGILATMIKMTIKIW